MSYCVHMAQLHYSRSHSVFICCPLSQVPAFMGYKTAQAASLAGVIVCLATLVVYCVFQVTSQIHLEKSWLLDACCKSCAASAQPGVWWRACQGGQTGLTSLMPHAPSALCVTSCCKRMTGMQHLGCGVSGGIPRAAAAADRPRAAEALAPAGCARLRGARRAVRVPGRSLRYARAEPAQKVAAQQCTRARMACCGPRPFLLRTCARRSMQRVCAYGRGAGHNHRDYQGGST